mgnify:CR=1 FL=1
MDARNNIFIGNTYAVYARFGSNNEFDYNVYNSNGTYLAYTTTLIDSLGEWQTLDTLNNMNAVEGDPVFLSQNDLHVVGLLANDAGDNSVGVTHDIDGDVRPSLIASTVDIGADEFDVVCGSGIIALMIAQRASQARFIGRQHVLRCDGSQMRHQSTPDGVSCKDGDLLTHDGTNDALEQIISAGNALWSMFLNNRPKKFIVSKEDQGIVPP